MSDTIVIEIPNFVRNVGANTKKARYYKVDPIFKIIVPPIKCKIPKGMLKSDDNNKIVNLNTKKYNIGKFNKKTKEFVAEIFNLNALLFTDGTSLTDDNKKYEFYIIDVNTKKLVNAGKTDTKLTNINGNLLYAGIHWSQKQTIVETIKREIIKYYPGKINIPFPLRVNYIFQLPYGKANWDLDNLAYFYRKAGNDILSNGKIGFDQVIEPALPNDSVEFIVQNIETFVPCKREEDSKLIIKISTMPNADYYINHLIEAKNGVI